MNLHDWPMDVKHDIADPLNLKVSKWVYSIPALIGLFFGVQNLQLRTGDDSGIFVSISALVARGARLYVDVYDMKEPIFYWLYGLAFWVGGIKGIALLELLLVVGSAVLCFRLIMIVVGSLSWASLTTVLFAGSLTGTFYAPIITSVAGLLSVLVVLNLLLTHRAIYYGAAIVIVAFVKVAFLPIVVVPTAVIHHRRGPLLRRLIEVFIGALVAVGVMISLLGARGELSGYLEMLQDQARYKEVYPEVVGLPKGLNAPVQLFQSAMGMSAYLLLFVAQGVILLRSRKVGALFRPQLFFLSIQAGAFGSIFLTGFWFHHLLPLSLFTLGFSGFVANHVLKKASFHSRIEGSSDRVLLNALLMGLCIVLATGSGWDSSVMPRSNFVMDLVSEVRHPPSVTTLNEMSLASREGIEFARLGPNDELGLATFLPPTWRLTCRFYYGQYGHESVEHEQETIDCVRNDPELLFISTGFFSLTRPAGNYESFRARLVEVVESEFDCVEVRDRPGSQVCTRR